MLFGVDVGGTTVKIGLVSEDNKLIDKFEIKTNIENNGSSILNDIKDAIYNYLENHNIDKNEITGIGFGVPGPVINNVVKSCINLGWGTVDVEKEFSKLLDWNPKIACSNDANVAALGEMSVNPSYKNVVMFTLGTGVGGGVIYNGKPIDGAHGAAGELGHFHLDKVHNYKCNCGLTGCLETVASATGVVNLAKEYLPKTPSILSNIEPDKLECKDIFDAAKANDALALKVIEEVGYYIGLAASIVAISIDPDAIIIGGGVSKAGKILLDIIEKYYYELSFHAVKDTKFFIASLGNDGGMLGAALLAK